MIKLNEKQKIAWKYLNDDTTETIIYGGMVGGGKTFLSAYFCFRKIIEYNKKDKDITILIGSKTITHLTGVFMKELRSICRLWNFKTQLLPNNEVRINNLKGNIILLHLANRPSDPEFDFLGGYNCSYLILEEAQNIPPKAIQTLMARVRKKVIGTNKILITCNPGQGYLKTNFYDKYITGTLDEKIKFIEASMYDNYHNLDDKYINKFDDMSEGVRKRLMGDWNWMSNDERLFDMNYIDDIFKKDGTTTGEFYLSIDLASSGMDKSVWILWKDFTIVDIRWEGTTLNEDISRITNEIQKKWNIKRGNIIFDSNGIGSVVDLNKWYIPFDNGKFKNDCYFLMKKKGFKIWSGFDLGKMIDGMTLEDRIRRELHSIKINSDGKISSKKEVKGSLGWSPDFIDAIMMRFYFHIYEESKVKVFIR